MCSEERKEEGSGGVFSRRPRVTSGSKRACFAARLRDFGGYVAISLLLIAPPIGAQGRERDHVVLGVGAVLTPAYQGADRFRILPIPAFDIKKGWFVASLRNGIGVVPINHAAIRVGVSAVFLQGYRRRDLPIGIDPLSNGVGARIFATAHARGFAPTIGVTKGLYGGTRGIVGDASVAYPIRLGSKYSLIPTAGVTWADAKHNDRYFGITAAESKATGLSQFRAAGGLKDVSGTVTAAYRLTEKFTFAVTGNVTSLLGSVNVSPKVRRKTQPTGFLTVSYRL